MLIGGFMEYIKKAINSVRKKGLFNIVGSTFINKVIAFFTNIALVRILTKGDYGIFTSAFNVYLIVDLFSGFGITNSVLYFASDKENDETRENYYRYAAFIGMAMDIVLFLITIIYARFAKLGIEESRIYIYMLSLLPIFEFTQSYFSIILRSRKENRKYARLLNISSASYAILGIIGSLMFGITGTIAGRYCSYIITTIIGFVHCRRYFSRNVKLFGNLLPKKKIEMIKYAIPCGSVTALNNILYKIDIMLISSLIGSAEILATYKTATIIPENMNFLPQSILVFALPLFIEHNNDSKWIKKNSKLLFLGMALFSGILASILFFGAPLIIKILWGGQYLDAVPYFRVLSISFFCIATFRITSTNILVAIGKVNFNLTVAIISGIANIFLDYFMVLHYGAMGAALATLFISILASALSFPYLYRQIKRIR